jgi:threonine/homoserine/homoserine lactone efflux protein
VALRRASGYPRTVISDGHLAGFALLSLALILIPGPNVLFVVSRSLMLGRGAGVATAAGGQIGASLQVAAVACGIGELVERSAAVFAVIKLAGAAYLAYLGVQAIRHRHSLSAALEATGQQKNVTVIVRDGIVVGVSNPKVIVFFVAVLPQFVDRPAGHVPLQMLLLGAVWSAIALVCDSSWALAAGSARAWLARSPRRLAAVGGAGGLAMIGIGVTLALTGRND